MRSLDLVPQLCQLMQGSKKAHLTCFILLSLDIPLVLIVQEIEYKKKSIQLQDFVVQVSERLHR